MLIGLLYTEFLWNICKFVQKLVPWLNPDRTWYPKTLFWGSWNYTELFSEAKLRLIEISSIRVKEVATTDGQIDGWTNGQDRRTIASLYYNVEKVHLKIWYFPNKSLLQVNATRWHWIFGQYSVTCLFFNIFQQTISFSTTKRVWNPKWLFCGI